jgi:hypothetical protein
MILQKIKEIEEEKEKNGIFPTHTTLIDLIKSLPLSSAEIRNELNKLFIENKIRVGRTINDNWIKTV